MRLTKSLFLACCFAMVALFLWSNRSAALDGGTLRINAYNGWSAFEVISQNDNPTGDGFSWSMPSTFDGLGASLADASTLRLQVNHERTDASISEVRLDLASFQTAISNTINNGSPGGGSFVMSARQAYERWSDDGGATWTGTSDATNTHFYRFCSGQSYRPNTFGTDRGFVDEIYITGEEGSTDRLFALDVNSRDFYQLSGTAGSASGGLGGIPFDAYENAALLDTGETDHIALMLSPDGGSQRMQIYIGEKGKDADGNASNTFLARNGLAYGSYYYLNDSLPTSGTSTNGFFDTTTAGALRSSKLEDIDTSPSDPTRAVLGDQNSGVFTFDFDLDFGSGYFDAANSSFSIALIQEHHPSALNAIGDADNVDWTAPTVLGGTNYSEGLVFVNEDNSSGEIWVTTPDGSELTLVGDTNATSSATESSGILDISGLVGYLPGSIVLTSNQGGAASLSVLINPNATLAVDGPSADFDNDGDFDGTDFLTWQRNFESGTSPSQGDADFDGEVDGDDLWIWKSQYGGVPATSVAATEPVPEPSTICLALLTGLLSSIGFRQQKKGRNR